MKNSKLLASLKLWRSGQLKIQHYLAPALIIVVAVLLRLFPHPANFAPIAAMALFGGVYLDKKYAIAFPLLAMIVSDMFLGFSQSTPFVYACFALTGLLGMWLKKRKTVFNVIAVSLFSSTLFFLVTNLNFALAYSLYPKTWEGQLQSYVYALPFFRNTVLGDLFYTGLFFGGYEAINAYFKEQGAKRKALTRSAKR